MGHTATKRLSVSRVPSLPVTIFNSALQKYYLFYLCSVKLWVKPLFYERGRAFLEVVRRGSVQVLR